MKSLECNPIVPQGASAECQILQGAGKGNRMGAQLRGKSRTAIQLIEDKAEAELQMATDGFNREAPTTEDELLLAEHASHPRVNPSEVPFLFPLDPPLCLFPLPVPSHPYTLCRLSPNKRFPSCVWLNACFPWPTRGMEIFWQK